MKSRWWVFCGLALVAIFTALLGTTVVLLRLESRERHARESLQHQKALRLALWRMDSWLAPLLIGEAARPHFDYQAWRPSNPAYTQVLSSYTEPGHGSLSPLVTQPTGLIDLHFQVEADGSVSSPQLPPSDVASAVHPAEAQARRERLENLRSALDAASPGPATDSVEDHTPTSADPRPTLGGLSRRPWAADSAPETEVAKARGEAEPSRNARGATEAAGKAREPSEPQESSPYRPELPRAKSKGQMSIGLDPEQERRLSSVQKAIQAVTPPASPLSRVDGGQPIPSTPPPSVEGLRIGAFRPAWLGTGSDRRLAFIRPVVGVGDSLSQGFVFVWSKLEQALLSQSADLLSQASLVPTTGDPTERNALATVPARLVSPMPALPPPSQTSPARLVLWLAWFAVVAGSAVAAIALRASIIYGDRRSRFASAVTHELRTPLTTFRMYSEMLAEDMVQDPDQRRGYIRTLHAESERLARLVENVLSYSRLEDGRRPARTEQITLSELMDRVRDPLERRAKEAGVKVSFPEPPPSTLDTDVEAVGQILSNLVDNACKYAPGSPIEFELNTSPSRLHLRIRDHGSGVDPSEAHDIFTPFRRGARGTTDKPGIGLGLALSRGLARDLGGELQFYPADGGGAVFELTLPS